jgi:lipoate-protein ligase A
MSPWKKSKWRLLLHGSADGATNMAVDEAVGTLVAEGASPPTIRFYSWSPATLSLGKNQPLSEVNLEACRAAGYHVVRRPTGGRAVLHAREITYSVAAPPSDPRLAGGVLDAYRRLSLGLIEGLRLLGIQVEQAGPEARAGDDVSAACFEVPSAYEISVGGKKLIGSAQRRTQGFVLQHGAIPLGGDVAEIAEYLNLSAEEREALKEMLQSRATTLEEVLGTPVSFHRAAVALAIGFERALNLELEIGELTSDEERLALELREKYSRLE